jgi:hypothetical protein
MTKKIVMDRTDVILLESVLDYVVNLDDREKLDYIEHFGNENFNEHDELEHGRVTSHLAQSHIYYKATLLNSRLLEAINE